MARYILCDMPNIAIKPPQWVIDKIENDMGLNDEGHLVWTNPACTHIKPGDLVGSLRKDGYRSTKFSKVGEGYRAVKVHHIVWYLTTGEWPTTQIDHKDNDPSNNLIGNLRAATPSQNCMNQALSTNNKLGEKNICFRLEHGIYPYYCVQIRRDRKHVFHKLFKTLEEAIKARDEALAKYHGEFART